MKFLWSSALKDLRRILRDPFAVLLWVGIPVLIATMIMLAFGGQDGPPPQAHLLVADEDDTFLTALLVGAMDRAEVVRLETVTLEEGRERISTGGASGLLEIPPGFSEAVLRDEPTTLRLVTNPAQRILPGILEEGLSILADGVFYLQRLLGDRLREFADGPPEDANTFPDQTITDFSLTINHLVDRLADYLIPPAIELETEVEETEAESAGNVGLLFFPGIVFMALMFMGQGLSTDVWEERNRGTLRRVIAAPQRLPVFLAGKLLAGAVLITVACTVAMLAGCLLFDQPLATVPLAVSWSAFTGTVFLAVMLLLQVLASSQRTAGMLIMMVLFPLLMAGGSFFPFESMPDWLARIGRLTPNGWAVTHLKRILAADATLVSLAIPFAGLAAVGLVAFALCARRLRGGFSGA